MKILLKIIALSFLLAAGSDLVAMDNPSEEATTFLAFIEAAAQGPMSDTFVGKAVAKARQLGVLCRTLSFLPITVVQFLNQTEAEFYTRLNISSATGESLSLNSSPNASAYVDAPLAPLPTTTPKDSFTAPPAARSRSSSPELSAATTLAVMAWQAGTTAQNVGYSIGNINPENFSNVVKDISSADHFETTVVNAARSGFIFTTEHITSMAKKAHQLKLHDGAVKRIFGHLEGFENAAREKLAEISGHSFTDADLLKEFLGRAESGTSGSGGPVNLREVAPAGSSSPSSNVLSVAPGSNLGNTGGQASQVPASGSGQNTPPPLTNSSGFSGGQVCAVTTALTVITSMASYVYYKYQQIPAEARAKMTALQLSSRVTREIGNDAQNALKTAQSSVYSAAAWTKKTVWPNRTA